MSVVGFDIGNENCVIAAVKQRGIDVLLNDESKRETPAIVCFGEKQRFLGAAGAASAMMNPKSTVSHVKKLIGRSFRDDDIQTELRRLPFETSEGLDGGILIHLRFMGEKHTFTPVQIMAMLLAHLKDITEKNLELPITDCVIGIPAYFTDLQRRAYLNAATIAGLKPLRLLHDCTATALSYGIYKTDFPKGALTYVAFVDIGHCDTQVSIVSFKDEHMKMLSHSFDSNLGGRDFDEVLFGYFAAQFKDNYQMDVYSNVRACIRLRAACEKLKKVLSANAEAPLSIECLMDEKDVKGFIKREEFEKLATKLFENISATCKKALADAGLSTARIHSVELVGSGSRIPAITRLLASLFSRDPSRTLNASDCVARGCAIQCAMLSPAFQVREYEVQDSSPFSIGLSINEGPIVAKANGVLFPKGHPFPSIKLLTFQRSSSFNLEAFCANPTELPAGVPTKISSFMIGPLQKPCSEKAKIKVKVQLNLNGIVTIESATLIDYCSPSEMDKVDSDLSSGTSTNSANDEDGDTIMHSESPDPSDHAKDKNRTSQKLAIPVTESINGGLNKHELLEAERIESQLAQQDRAVEQAKNQKNALESYVYEMRDKLFNQYRSFANDQEREGISRNLQETEEWLYEDGDDETESAYIFRMLELRKLVDPIENWYKDEDARAQATKVLLKCIRDYRMSVDSLPSEDKEMIINECDKVEQWLRDQTEQQQSLPKNADPVLWSIEIKNRTEDLKSVYKQILKREASTSNPEDNKNTHGY